MRRLGVCMVLLAAQLASSAEPETVQVWPNEVPGGLGQVSERQAAELRKKNVPDRVFHVDHPTLSLYLVKGNEGDVPRPAVVICPGGGYNVLAWEKEGVEVARWLNTIGVSAFVLKYRVPRRDSMTPHAAPLQDAQRAMRVVRGHAKQWNVDPQRVGMLGFSAGGNLTVMTGLHANKMAYDPIDKLDQIDCRPDFLIPIYPAYLGSDEDPHRLNSYVKVDSRTPPMFIAVTQDDQDRGIHAALLFAELTKAKVPAELHVYSKGGHGYGLRPSSNPVSQWPARCADWLGASGYLPVTVTEK